MSQTDISELVEHFRLDAQYQADEILITYPHRRRRNAKRVERWTRKNLVGQGGFGSVWLYQRSGEDTVEVRAFKQIRKGMTSRQNFSLDYAHELYAMSKLSRDPDNFPEFYGWCEDNNYLFLSMEYFPHGDLEHCVHGPVVEPEVKQIVSQLLTGLQTIHKQGITHRDLNPQNIFVVEKSPRWWIKIGDFGISKRIQEKTAHHHTVIGSSHFMAPEILDEDNLMGYTNAVDMWALGCIAYLLLAFSLPFPNSREIKQYARDNASLSMQPLYDQNTSMDAVQFIKTLLSVQLGARPSSQDAGQLHWLRTQVKIRNSQESVTVTDQGPVSTDHVIETIGKFNETNHKKVPREADIAFSLSSLGQPLTAIKARSIEEPRASETADMLNDIHERGIMLLDAKEFAEAGAILRLVVEGRKKTLGPEHSDTLSSIHSLGVALYRQEKHAEAEAMSQQAAEGRKKTLGSEHSDTLYSIHYLGAALYAQRKYAEAEAMFQQAAEGRKKTLGSEHSDTLFNIHSLGAALYEQGKYAEAEAMFQQAAEGRKKTLGSEHSDTLFSIYYLGVALYEQGRYAEAEAMSQQAAEGRKKTLGSEHSDTLSSTHSLGKALYKQGKYAEAETMFKKTAKGRKKTLGFEHPGTLSSIHDLGRALYEQGKYAEAEAMFQQAAEGREKNLGSEHSDTLFSIHYLGAALHWQGKYAEAEAMSQQAAEGRKKTLGSEHSDTLLSINNLGAALHGQGKYAEAEAMYQQAAEGRKKTLGPQHSDTLTSIRDVEIAALERALARRRQQTRERSHGKQEKSWLRRFLT